MGSGGSFRFALFCLYMSLFLLIKHSQKYVFRITQMVKKFNLSMKLYMNVC